MDGAGGEDTARAALATLRGRHRPARPVDTLLVAGAALATRVARDAASLAPFLAGSAAAATTLAPLVSAAIGMAAARLFRDTPLSAPFSVLGTAAAAVATGRSPATVEATIGETALIEPTTDTGGWRGCRHCRGYQRGHR
jgi:hypothetical protein